MAEREAIVRERICLQEDLYLWGRYACGKRFVELVVVELAELGLSASPAEGFCDYQTGLREQAAFGYSVISARATGLYPRLKAC